MGFVTPPPVKRKWTPEPTYNPTSREPVVFYAMGDMPYTPEEDKAFPLQISGLSADANQGAEFLVHVGDFINHKIKVADQCPEWRYKMVRDVLKKSPVKTFIIPGDNDWNDCP